MSVVGYARVNTGHQSPDCQRDALTAAGCERVFTDMMSGVRDDRPALSALLNYVGAGDSVVAVALARLGRSLSGVIRTVEKLTASAVLLRSLREGIDYATPTAGCSPGSSPPSPAANASSCTNAPPPPAKPAACAAGTPAGTPSSPPARPARSAACAKAARPSPPASGSPAPPFTVR